MYVARTTTHCFASSEIPEIIRDNLVPRAFSSKVVGAPPTPSRESAGDSGKALGTREKRWGQGKSAGDSGKAQGTGEKRRGQGKSAGDRGKALGTVEKRRGQGKSPEDEVAVET